ncbi:hypothetical protein MBLNU13_g00608t2 [Cladosporium sp. NU13]
MATPRAGTTSQDIVNQLQADNRILKVSAELADDLQPDHEGICRLCTTTYEALRIFVGWLLRNPIQSKSQELLAQSWRFGARYYIPAYQNEVMRQLVGVLEAEPVDVFAVRDAYVYTCDFEPRIADIIVKRDRLLRKAFVTQLASNSRLEHPWESEEEAYMNSGLHMNHDFHKDFFHAVCFGSSEDGFKGPGARIEELLVEESKR